MCSKCYVGIVSHGDGSGQLSPERKDSLRFSARIRWSGANEGGLGEVKWMLMNLNMITYDYVLNV